jgi:hypothetical protein
MMDEALKISIQLEDAVSTALGNIQIRADAALGKINELKKAVASFSSSAVSQTQQVVQQITNIGKSAVSNASTVKSAGTTMTSSYENIAKRLREVNDEMLEYDDLAYQQTTKINHLIKLENERQDLMVKVAKFQKDTGSKDKDINKEIKEFEELHATDLKRREKLLKDISEVSKELGAYYTTNATLMQLNEEQLAAMGEDKVKQLKKLIELEIIKAKIENNPERVRLYRDNLDKLGEAAKKNTAALGPLASVQTKVRDGIGGLIFGTTKWQSIINDTTPIIGNMTMLGALSAAVATLGTALVQAAARAEKFHTAMFRGLGTMDQIAAKSADMSIRYNMLGTEIDDTITGLRNVGASASTIDEVTNHVSALVRTTGVGVEDAARLAVRIKAVGGSAKEAQGYLMFMYEAAKQFNLNAQDLGEIMDKVVDSSFRLAYQGIDASKKFAENLTSAAAAAKELGVKGDMLESMFENMTYDVHAWAGIFKGATMTMTTEQKRVKLLSQAVAWEKEMAGYATKGDESNMRRLRFQIEGISQGQVQVRDVDKFLQLAVKITEKEKQRVAANLSINKAMEQTEAILKAARTESTGAVRAFEEMMQTLWNGLQIAVMPLMVIFKTIFTLITGIFKTIYMAIAPLLKVVQTIAGWLDFSEQLSDVFTAIGTIFGGIVKALTPIITIIGGIWLATNYWWLLLIPVVKIFSDVLIPVLNVIAGVFGFIGDLVFGVVEDIKELISWFAGWITSYKSINEALKTVSGWMKVIREVASDVSKVFMKLGGEWENVKKDLPPVYYGLKAILGVVMAIVAAKLWQSWGGGIKGMLPLLGGVKDRVLGVGGALLKGNLGTAIFGKAKESIADKMGTCTKICPDSATAISKDINETLIDKSKTTESALEGEKKAATTITKETTKQAITTNGAITATQNLSSKFKLTTDHVAKFGKVLMGAGVALGAAGFIASTIAEKTGHPEAAAAISFWADIGMAVASITGFLMQFKFVQGLVVRAGQSLVTTFTRFALPVLTRFIPTVVSWVASLATAAGAIAALTVAITVLGAAVIAYTGYKAVQALKAWWEADEAVKNAQRMKERRVSEGLLKDNIEKAKLEGLDKAVRWEGERGNIKRATELEKQYNKLILERSERQQKESKLSPVNVAISNIKVEQTQWKLTAAQAQEQAYRDARQQGMTAQKATEFAQALDTGVQVQETYQKSISKAKIDPIITGPTKEEKTKRGDNISTLIEVEEQGNKDLSKLVQLLDKFSKDKSLLEMLRSTLPELTDNTNASGLASLANQWG